MKKKNHYTDDFETEKLLLSAHYSIVCTQEVFWITPLAVNKVSGRYRDTITPNVSTPPSPHPHPSLNLQHKNNYSNLHKLKNKPLEFTGDL